MIVKVYKQTQVKEDVHWEKKGIAWVLANKHVTVAVVTRKGWFLWDSYGCGRSFSGHCEGFKDGKTQVKQVLKNKEML
jgi:hypothetical protein